MRVLLQTKDQNAPVLGIPSFTQNLIGDFFAGESAWSYHLSGYDITVGYYHNVAKYVAFRKLTGEPLEPADIHSLQEFLGPISNWSTSGDTLSYHELTGPGTFLDASGWAGTTKPYFFVHASGIIVDRSAIDKKMPEGKSKVNHPKPPKPEK